MSKAIPPAVLVCKDNSFVTEYLTLGKRYMTTAEDEQYYYLQSDKGGVGMFSKSRFDVVPQNPEDTKPC